MLDFNQAFEITSSPRWGEASRRKFPAQFLPHPSNPRHTAPVPHGYTARRGGERGRFRVREADAAFADLSAFTGRHRFFPWERIAGVSRKTVTRRDQEQGRLPPTRGPGPHKLRHGSLPGPRRPCRGGRPRRCRSCADLSGSLRAEREPGVDHQARGAKTPKRGALGAAFPTFTRRSIRPGRS